MSASPAKTLVEERSAASQIPQRKNDFFPAIGVGTLPKQHLIFQQFLLKSGNTPAFSATARHRQFGGGGHYF